MDEKKVYEKPKMDVIVFEAEDIIKTSGDDNETPIIKGEIDETDEIFYL